MGSLTLHKCNQCKNIIDPDIVQYYYKCRYWHHDCLLKKLKNSKKPKFSPEEIRDIIINAKKDTAIALSEKKTVRKNSKVILPNVDKKQVKIQEENRLKLLDFIEAKYVFTARTNSVVTRKLNSINRGTYKTLNGTKISDEKLYNMFKYYSNELDYIRNYMKKQFDDNCAMFFYDLTILVGKLENYDRDIKKAETAKKETKEVIDDVDVTGYLGKRIETINNEDDDIDLSGFYEGYF